MDYRDSGVFTRALFPLVVLFVMVLLGLLACDNASQKGVPIGDHGGLEQLAAAYRKVLQAYPVAPASMPPEDKKEFVERVFTAAGYQYSATLKAFARHGIDGTNQDHRDLVDLLFLPHKGLTDAELPRLYPADELAAVRSLQAGLR